MIQIEKNGPTMLIILDGFGYRKEKKGNAEEQAFMPTWKKWLNVYPHTLLQASGKAVGLPTGVMGNSEVGHLCIGSGRIVKTVLCKFHETIDNESFFKNSLLIRRFTQLKERLGALHLIGLVSDAGIHSHEKHLYAFLQLAKQVGIEVVYIHAFLDGRDTPACSAEVYLERLECFCKQHTFCKLASLHGRFYAMDRDCNWDRTEKSYKVLCGMDKVGCLNNGDWRSILHESYSKSVTDEFFEPRLIDFDGRVKKGDGIVFFNFRPDRARQLTECFIDSSFNKFPVSKINSTNETLLFFVSTARFNDKFKKFNNDVLFEDEKIEHTLLDEIAKQTKHLENNKVFVIAETEKYAHVTYFFRGKIDKRLDNEEYVLIPSIKAKNYINYPKMSAEKITAKIIASVRQNFAYFYLVNYANCDMVGHSGDFNAAVKACECIDRQLEILFNEVVEKYNGTMIITADHGNAEEMIDLKTGEAKTSHTCNPVQFMIVNKSLIKKIKDKNSKNYNSMLGLASIAPTILKLLKLNIPAEMEQRTIKF